MKKILSFLILSGLVWAMYGQTPYDTVNVYDPQNFVEQTVVDTANFQFIGRKNNLNSRMNPYTMKRYSTPDVFATWVNTVFDSVGNSSTYYDYFVTDSTGRTWYVDDIGRGKLLDDRQRGVIDSFYIAADTLWIDENGVLWSIPVDSLGGTGGAAQTLSVSGDSLEISGGNTVKIPQQSPYKIDEYWIPGSLADTYGNSVDWGDTSTLFSSGTWRYERPMVAHNTDVNRIVIATRKADAHGFTTTSSIVAKYSDDLGETWSDEYSIFDNAGGTRDPINLICTWDRKTGLYYLAYQWYLLSGGIGYADIRILTSPDGVTWTAKDTILEADIAATGYFGLGVNGDFLRGRDGSLMLPIYTRYLTSDSTTFAPSIHVAKSMNDGESWALTLIDSTSARLQVENILRYGDGDTLYTFSRGEVDSLYRYFSTDDGATWSTAANITPASYIKTRPDMTIFPGGRIMLFFRTNNTTFLPHYAFSDDWGDTWTASAALPDLPTAKKYYYSDFENIAPNAAILAYSLSETSATGYADTYVRQVVNGAHTRNGASYGVVKSKEEAAAATTVIDLQSRIRKVSRVDVSSLSGTVTITASNPTDGGQYVFYFDNDGDTLYYDFPASFRQINRDTLGLRLPQDLRVSCDYLIDSAFYLCEYSVDENYTPPPPTLLEMDSIYVWFRADTLVYDSAGAVIASGTNKRISEWKDLSGNGHHVTQADTSKMPIYEATGFGSDPAIYFDGVTDWLASSAHWWGNDSLTVYAVVAFADSTRDATEAVISRWDADTKRQWIFSGKNAGSGYRVAVNVVDDGGILPGDLYNDSVAKRESYVLYDTWSTSVAVTSGVALNATEYSVNTSEEIFNTTATLDIGADNTQATSGTTGKYFNGRIVELIVYKAAHDAAQRGNVRTYLNNRHNLY